MNYNEACDILEIDYDHDPADIKKQYRIMALQYHPDKNESLDATKKFQEIQEAYQYLLHNDPDPDRDPDRDEDGDDPVYSYRSLLVSFFKKIVENEHGNHLFCTIVEKLSSMCEESALEAIRKLDKNMLINTYKFIVVHRKVLHFSEYFVERISEIISEKIGHDECIVLNPTIDDLFDNNLFGLKVNGLTYIVPLWHHELVYDNSGNDIYVRCEAVMPEGVTLLPNNNVRIKLHLTIQELWENEGHTFSIGKKEFHLSSAKVALTPRQLIALNDCGISRTNTKNIYDIHNKSDIIIDLNLTL